MKELKDICISLDLAKRLKGKGVKQDSLFYWTGLDMEGITPSIIKGDTDTLECISAYTANELLELLPIVINEKGKIKIPMNIRRNTEKHYIDYSTTFRTALAVPMQLQDDRVEIYAEIKEKKYIPAIVESKKFADALGLMLEYLIDNKLIEV